MKLVSSTPSVTFSFAETSEPMSSTSLKPASILFAARTQPLQASLTFSRSSPAHFRAPLMPLVTPSLLTPLRLPTRLASHHHGRLRVAELSCGVRFSAQVEFVRPAEGVTERCSVPGSVGAATEEALICTENLTMEVGLAVAFGDEGGRVPRSDCWPKSSWGPKFCWASNTVEMFSSIWTCLLTKLMVSGPLGVSDLESGRIDPPNYAYV